MSLQIWFVLVFATIGFLVSLAGGLLVGNRLSYISFVTGISSLVFCGLGLGVYAILEKRVPEFLEFLRQLPGVLKSQPEESSPEMGETMPMENWEGGLGEGSMAEGLDTMQPTPPPKTSKFGDHIIVDKIAIKNEPKLMAQAIRTMLARDEENK